MTRAKGLVGFIATDDRSVDPAADLGQMDNWLPSSLPLQHATAPGAAFSATDDAAHQDGVLAAIAGHPVWRDPELHEIATAEGHAAALITAYTRSDSAFLKQMSGSFCLAIHDSNTGRLLAATDRLGRQPMYYSRHGQAILIASNADAILAANQSTAQVRKQGIYEYVYFHMVPSPGSIYEGIQKLPAAHCIDIQGTELKVTRYWQPTFQNGSTQDQLQLGQELKHVLKRAVQRARGEDDSSSTAAFLSGGLDSSTVAGMLSEINRSQAHAYSIGFSAEGYDEMAYARITAEHFGIKLHEYYVTPEDIVSALPDIATSYCEPFGNSSALPAWFCARFAADNGVSRLLAGDGGDELFAGNERYAKQQVFERYCESPAFLRRGIVEPVVMALPQKLPLVTKARSFLAQANTPLPDRLQTYNFLHRHLAQEIFSPDFLANIDTEEPLELQRKVFKQPEKASKLDRMLYLDWQFTLADNDLRKVSQMCEKAGVEVTYPMLDDELVEFSTTIPDRMKLKNGDLRHFYKQALRDWLPEVTINKEKHGFGLPFGVWMQEHEPLREMAYDNLLALKQRSYFKPGFIDHAIELHRSGHASYYGELIWIMMVLELWLSSRADL